MISEGDSRISKLQGNIDHATDAIESDIETLEQLDGRLVDACDQYKEMDDEVATTFGREASSIRADLLGVESVSGLENIVDQIEEAIEAPYRNAAISALDSLCNTLGIDLSEDTRESIESGFEARGPELLGTITDAYEDIDETLDRANDTIIELVRGEIEGERQRYLSDPDSQLKTTVNQYDSRQATLTKLQDGFKNAGGWTPNLPDDISSNSEYYVDLEDSIDNSEVSQTIKDIDSELTNRPNELSFDAAIANQLEANLPGELSNIKNELSDIYSTLVELGQYDNIIDNCDRLATKLEDYDLYSNPIETFEEKYRTLRASEPASLSSVESDLEELKKSYKSWTDEMAQNLARYQEFAKLVEEEFDIVEDFDSGAAFSLSEATTEDIDTQPIEALDAHQAFEEWLATIRASMKDDESGPRSEVIQRAAQLYLDGRIDSGKINSEIFEELSVFFEGQLVVALDTRDD